MTKQLHFAEWMANTVQSIHYSDNEQMERAFERLEDLEVTIVEKDVSS